MEPVAPSVSLTPFLTSGDLIGSYQIPGIPDGLRVLKVGNRLRILTNQEWSASNTTAAVRNSTGGQTKGSFISELTYNTKTGTVIEAKDFMTDIVW